VAVWTPMARNSSGEEGGAGPPGCA
jgi:hypothetical protein